MKKFLTAAAVGLAFALPAAVGLACGYCAEDKIASVYDHAAVKKALGNGHQVAFFHIEGILVPERAIRRALLASAESVEGVDRGSVRISLETASLSLAFDSRRTSLAAVQTALDSKLAAKRLSLFYFQGLDRPAELKAAKR